MGKYSYTSLNQVVKSTDKYHHVFGVVRKFQEQGVFIKDESYDSIKVDFSITCDGIVPRIKPGNIIRIHRLITIGPYQWKCIKPSDIVIFSSFKDKDLEICKVRYEAKEPTIEQTDFMRVAELEQWLSKEILKIRFEILSGTGWVDMICQIVDVKDVSAHRVVLIVRDGTKPRVKFNWLSPTPEIFSDYQADELVCITVWDQHAAKARKLQKGNYIIIFNLEMSHGKIQFDNYELHLRGGSHHGKKIRNVHVNSYLGVGFTERLASKAPKLPSQRLPKPVPTTIIEEVPPSQETSYQPQMSSTQKDDISDSTQNKFFDDHSLSWLDSVTPSQVNNNEPLSPSPIIATKKRKTKHLPQFPHFFEFEIPKGVYEIEDYLKLNSDGMVGVRAKAVKYQPMSKDIIDFIRLICPTCTYQTSLSFECLTKLKEAKGTVAIIPCPNCHDDLPQSKLIPTFSISLQLQDSYGYNLAVSLSKYDVNKLLGVHVISVLQNTEEAEKIFNFLHYICPQSNGGDLTRDRSEIFHPFLKWVIKRQLKKQQQLQSQSQLKNEYDYRVLTVLPLKKDEDDRSQDWLYSEVN